MFELGVCIVWQVLDVIDVDVGDCVFIYVVVGGVGYFVVQFVWEWDFYVIGIVLGLNEEYF